MPSSGGHCVRQGACFVKVFDMVLRTVDDVGESLIEIQCWNVLSVVPSELGANLILGPPTCLLGLLLDGCGMGYGGERGGCGGRGCAHDLGFACPNVGPMFSP